MIVEVTPGDCDKFAKKFNRVVMFQNLIIEKIDFFQNLKKNEYLQMKHH